MKNKLEDLYNALFVEIETLQDEDSFKDEDGSISKEKAELAIKRAEAVNKIVDSAMVLTRLQLDAVKIATDLGMSAELPDTLGIKENVNGNARKALAKI